MTKPSSIKVEIEALVSSFYQTADQLVARPIESNSNPETSISDLTKREIFLRREFGR